MTVITTQSHLPLVHVELDSLYEKHRSVVQRIADLEKAPCLAQEEGCQLKDDMEAKSLELTAAVKEINEKYKVLIDLEVVPTLSLDNMKELGGHEQVMLSIQSSLNLNT